MAKRYKVTDKEGKVSYHDDINRAIQKANDGDTITDTEAGQSYQVKK
jgi:hypothetical protein